MYSLHCTFPLMEAKTCAGAWLVAGVSCWWLEPGPWYRVLGLPGEAQGSWICVSGIGAGLSGGAIGAVTAGSIEPLAVGRGCPRGLSSTTWWLPGESPGVASLGWDQEGGGRLWVALEVPGDCPSAEGSTGDGLLTSASCGTACAAWGSSCQTSLVSWLSWALMAWFSWVIHASLDWTSLSSARSRSSGAVSPRACWWWNLHSLAMCLPLGWLAQGCRHTVHSGSKPEACKAMLDKMEHLGPVGSWWPCMERPQEEQHSMVPCKCKDRHEEYRQMVL